MQDNISIVSANMNHQPDALISMMETTDAHILLIQELSWGCLVPKKSDEDPDSIEVKGTCSHPRWRTILPITSPSDPPPHIAIFLRSELTDSLTYSIIPAMNSYACLGICLDTDTPIFIINYYHHVIDKRPNLRHLLSLPLPDRPLMLCDDFNIHSSLWSPPDLPISPWAEMLENWLDTHNLMSLVPKGAITQHHKMGRDSLLDHIFANLDFLGNPFFPGTCLVSFERSISSNHAALFLDLPISIPPPTLMPQPGWIVEDQMEREWKQAFGSFPRPLITDIASLSQASEDLLTLTSSTCDRFFARRKATHTKGLAWWNEACHIAATNVSRAHGPE